MTLTGRVSTSQDDKSPSPHRKKVEIALMIIQGTGRALLFAIFIFLIFSSVVFGQSRQRADEVAADLPSDASGSIAPLASPLPIIAPALKPPRKKGVNWGELFKESLQFLAVEHVFRCATEPGTRDGFGTSFWGGYLNSVGNLHGWADGDPFYVNYVGHPMQGAVSGYIWMHNDRAYRDVEFGKNRRYWKAKLRATAFSYLQSVQFEIGPVSEASIGHIQSLFPQQGFVDHVVTPFIGTGWSIAEDWLDRKVIRGTEARTSNRLVRGMARVWLNPSRSMANVMGTRVPWYRDSRAGLATYQPEVVHDAPGTAGSGGSRPADVVTPLPGVAPFEFTMASVTRTYLGEGAKGTCLGGGGSGALRVAPEWQVVVDVSGCKLLGLDRNLSGDSLSYMAGQRWTPQVSSRWTPHAQILVGGTKLTQERIYPGVRAILESNAKANGTPAPQHEDYTRNWETNGFAISAGSGVDVRLNSALTLRVASLEYSHSWRNELNGINYRHSLQFTSGLVLRMGTW